jgi:hypothetical protein
VIARRVTHVDPDTALFAGIMHEVAGFYMLASAGEFPEVMDGEPEDWVEHGELEIGRGVMTHLGVPDGVFKAIESMWVGLRALPPETLGDTLLLANDCRRCTRRYTSGRAPPPCRARAPSTSWWAKARCTPS